MSDFFQSNFVDLTKTFRAFYTTKKLALTSMQKLFDPQYRQSRSTPVFEIVSDPKMGGEN
jgi:hypothetical protein